MHDLLPPRFCPKYFNVLPSEHFSDVVKHVRDSGITYPLIVKPEIGWQGILFRKIEDEEHLKEYHSKRDKFCKYRKIQSSKVAGGFVSLLVKGILIRQKSIYSIHYRLIPYMRKKASLEYGQAIREASTKR